MYLLSNSMRPNDLKSAIIPNPLVVSADATVMEAIALMSSGRSQCDAENHSDNHQQEFQQEARSPRRNGNSRKFTTNYQTYRSDAAAIGV
jgi:hypothetical protein